MKVFSTIMLASLVFSLAFPALVTAQTPAAPGVPTAAQATSQTEPTTQHLSSTEGVALRFIKSEFEQARSDYNNFSNDMLRSHPGYHFDPNLEQLVKNDTPKSAPVAPVAPATPVVKEPVITKSTTKK